MKLWISVSICCHADSCALAAVNTSKAAEIHSETKTCSSLTLWIYYCEPDLGKVQIKKGIAPSLLPRALQTDAAIFPCLWTNVVSQMLCVFFFGLVNLMGITSNASWSDSDEQKPLAPPSSTETDRQTASAARFKPLPKTYRQMLLQSQSSWLLFFWDPQGSNRHRPLRRTDSDGLLCRSDTVLRPECQRWSFWTALPQYCISVLNLMLLIKKGKENMIKATIPACQWEMHSVDLHVSHLVLSYTCAGTSPVINCIIHSACIWNKEPCV